MSGPMGVCACNSRFCQPDVRSGGGGGSLALTQGPGGHHLNPRSRWAWGGKGGGQGIYCYIWGYPPPPHVSPKKIELVLDTHFGQAGAGWYASGGHARGLSCWTKCFVPNRFGRRFYPELICDPCVIRKVHLRWWAYLGFFSVIMSFNERLSR